MEITRTISHLLLLSILPPLAVSLQGCGQYLNTLLLMIPSVLHSSEHSQSAPRTPGLCRLNIAVLLLLHQTLPGPSTNRTALNRMEVKLVFCLRFEVPLHSPETLPLNYKLLCSPFTITYHLLLLRVSLPSFILAFSSYFLLFDTVIISHAHSAHSYLSCLFIFPFPFVTLCILLS